MSERDASTRLPSVEDWEAARPVYVVWELTLACDQRCAHCGSRAGRPRAKELGLDECLDVVAQLAALGTREITLIGGEAYLHAAWLDVVRAISAAGMLCTLQTGGRLLDAGRLDQAVEAGLASLGVSIDGPDAIHDDLRRARGSAAAAWRTLALARERGLPTTVNTTVTPRSLPELEGMFARILAAGVKTWQVGINVAMGRAADAVEHLLQPYQLLELMPILAQLARRGRDEGLLIMPGNTIGYFGPEEALLRHGGAAHMHWTGCNAGRSGMGIESDGTVKACPSLPRGDYTAGQVGEHPIAKMWREADGARYVRTRSVDDLWGFCRGCVHAEDCLGGCTWVSHSFLGRPGNNPYCHHRALELARQGLRERVERLAAPPGEPFDLGEFALLIEPLDGRGEAQRQRPPPWQRPTTTRRDERGVPRRLSHCEACGSYSRAPEGVCARCGFDLGEAALARARHLREARRALVRLRVLMNEPTS